MRVTIITVVYNGRSYIIDAVRSVLGQSYGNIEYIVIDGGSVDGTLEALSAYMSDIDVLVSEPDSGIYDAMNKGLALATGDIVGFLNADDMLASANVIEEVVRAFDEDKMDVVYGDLRYVDQNGERVLRYWSSSSIPPKNAFQNGWHPAHPTFYARRSAYAKLGGFDCRYKISADFELMLRFLQVCGISSKYVPIVFVNMRVGGVSNANFRNILRGNWYIYKAFRSHGLSVGVAYFLKRFFSKLMQRFSASGCKADPSSVYWFVR